MCEFLLPAPHVHGLTTAASLWATASIGIVIAYGYYLSGVLVALILLTLLAIPTRKQDLQKEPAHRRPSTYSASNVGVGS
jgi:uncharacterized membrane protein YhiD involved in acid resistance